MLSERRGGFADLSISRINGRRLGQAAHEAEPHAASMPVGRIGAVTPGTRLDLRAALAAARGRVDVSRPLPHAGSSFPPPPRR